MRIILALKERTYQQLSLPERYKMNSFDGILSSEGASIDAYKFAHDLFQKNRNRGLRIYDQTEIKKSHMEIMSLVLKILAGEYDPLLYIYRFNR